MKVDDYKNINQNLDDILAQLESGELDVDEALKLYEKGNKLIKDLEKYLKDAKNRVKKLN